MSQRRIETLEKPPARVPGLPRQFVAARREPSGVFNGGGVSEPEGLRPAATTPIEIFGGQGGR